MSGGVGSAALIGCSVSAGLIMGFMGLGLIVGFTLCLIPGFWLFGIWTAATPSMALERTGIGRSFGRSRDLVQGMFWRVFGIRVLALVGAGVCSYLLSLPFNVSRSIGSPITFESEPFTFFTIRSPSS